MTLLAASLAAPVVAAEAAGLTAAGWAVMTVSLVAVLVSTGWCFYRILTLPPVVAERLHGQPAIDTGDTVDAD